MAADRAKTAPTPIRLLTNRVLLPMQNNMMQQQRLTKNEQQYQADRAPAHTMKAILSGVVRWIGDCH